MIVFGRDHYDQLIERATADREEVCGILGGRIHDDRSIVTSVHSASNAASMPSVRYAIDPEEQFDILESIDDRGHEVIGFYHSHPSGPPAPSETDAARATWPDRSYVIVALDGQPFLGSWRWRSDDERFEQEVVAVTRSD